MLQELLINVTALATCWTISIFMVSVVTVFIWRRTRNW